MESAMKHALMTLPTLLALALGFSACSTPPATKGSTDNAPMAEDCCAKSKAALSRAPACCQKNLGKAPSDSTGCCKDGMTATADPSTQPACCKETLALRAEMSECCAKALFEGDAPKCCADMKSE
jgi:hypothetical protein